MPPRYRVTYVTGSSNIADDSITQIADTACSGPSLTTAVLHTVTSSSAGTVEQRDVVSGAVAIRYAITGRGGGGSIHIRIDYSSNGAFTDTQVLFDAAINYGSVAPGAVECAVITGVVPASPCGYGTRAKSTAPAAVTVDPTLLNNASIAHGMSWVAAKLAATLYSVQRIPELCSQPPPDPGVVQAGDWQGNIAGALRALDALLWDQFCECVPGTPSPVPYPLWSSPQPSGDAVAPSFPVSTPGDPAALSQILSLLAQILQLVTSDLELDTIVQRWAKPFGDVPGITHAGLTGEGSVDVSRALGLLVTVTQLPEVVTTFPGNPIYIRDLGWLAVDDGGAMLQELRVTRQQQRWFPTQMQLATRVSWSLKADVEIAVQVLSAEP